MTNVQEHKINKQDLSNGKTKSQNLAPGFQVLGQLASDLEALQRRRESEGKVSLTSSTTSHSKDIQVKEPVRKKAYELKPPEEWAENEVLDWLRDKDLGYFVELFDGCDIDGDYLLQVTEGDLIELEVDDAELRKKFLLSVNDLLNAQADDDVDLSLPGLEDDSGSDWGSQEEIKDEQHHKKNLRVVLPSSDTSEDFLRPPTGFSEGHQSQLGKRIEDWTQDDVVVWLQSIRLGNYAKNFYSHHITGAKLKNIDMSLLDQMKIDSPEDREKLLSSLYDVSNPTNGPKDNSKLMSAIDEASEYDKKKYIAAVRVMQSPSPNVQLLPAESGGDTTLERSDRQDSLCSTGSESDSRGSTRSNGKGKKKKRRSITKLRDALTSKSKNPSLVRVWTDIGTAKDRPVRLKLDLEEDDSCKDLVNYCLESLNMVEDPRLYCIAEVCVADDKDHSTVSDREMADDESPLKVRRNWRESLSGHFELRQRTAQGGVIKLVLKLPDDTPKGKLVALSLSTPARELIPLALHKYELFHEDPTDFCLLEVDKKGDLHDIDEDTLLLQRESHAYVLCMKESKEELVMSTSENNREKEKEQSERAGSFSSSTSSDESQTSSHASEILALKVDETKLNQLEKEMATIEKSLQPRIGRSVSWNVNVKSRREDPKDSTPLRPLHIEGQTQDRLQQLENENKKLQERLKEFENLEDVFGKLKSTLNRLNTETNLKLLERRRASSPDLDSLPRDLAVPMFQLEGVTQEVTTKQAKVDKLKSELESLKIKSDNDNNYQSISSKLRIEEANLVAVKLEQARILCVMEVAMADYQLSCAKRKDLPETRAFATVLPPNKPYIILSVIVNAGAEGYKFELGSREGKKGIYIGKCADGETMSSGDRVIEINNHSTFSSSVAEGNTKLNSTSRVKLVLLREMGDDALEWHREAKSLKEMLSTNVTKLEKAEKEKRELNAEIGKLKSALTEAKAKSSSPSSEKKSPQPKDISSILANLDDDVPLWEAVKSHTKSEILEVFREELQEASRQKQYLDQLYALMLEKAPELLEEMEQDFEASEISGDEEFC